MKKPAPRSPSGRSIRQRAEEKARERHPTPERPPSEADARALLHELQVHQIELEMQNEELQRTQMEAQEAASKYSDLFDFAPVGYFVLDARGVIREINLAGAALLGLDRRSVVGQPFEQYVAPDSRPELGGFLRGVRPSEGKCSCEARLLRHGQDPCDVLIEGTVAEGGAGERQGCRLAVRDITARKSAEKAVRQSEERFRDLYENAPNAYFSVGVDGRIRRCNRSAGELLGVTPADLVGKPVLDFYADTPHGRQKAAEVLQRFRSGETVRDEELQMQKADGSFVWINLSVNPLRDADGRIVEGRSVVVDITKRKVAEESLRRSEARYRSFVNVTGQLGWTTNAAGEVVEDLPSWRAYTGQTRDDVLGRGWSSALHPDDIERTAEVWRGAVAGRRSFETEYRIRRHDGIYRHFLARGAPVLGTDGSLLEWVGVCIDITERRCIDEALRFLAQYGSAPAGEDFFRALARYLARSLDMDYVCIDRLQGDMLTARTVAVFSDGKFEDNVSYALKDTPCGDVVAKRVCCFPKGVRQLFPRDADLQKMVAESYVGTVLWGFGGQPIGLIAVIGRRPLTSPEQARMILQLAAMRAAGEMERWRVDEELRANNRSLTEFNRVFVGRELRMVELKEEVNELCARTGQPPRYPPEGRSTSP